ncbi:MULTISPECIES: ATP-binding protein [unclassified Kitasatospora]|uniref:ATP-binding protein n=1 Tax=unclassified Kitasatospora TaxID=2633591 RepID=UPI002476FA55|nr:ATP-binding protein [Kitasatospora sp. MAP12-44]
MSGSPGGLEEAGKGLWRIVAAAQESSVPQVRHAVRDLLRAQGITGPCYQDVTDGLLLIVSELVTNAVTHAALLSPQVTTEVVIRDGQVRVAVEDGHPYRPKAVQSDHGQTGGRGLMLVKSIALDAGGSCDVERTGDGGKVIWASLPLPPPVEAASVASVDGGSGTPEPGRSTSPVRRSP